jgi:hypothetical protein
MCKPKADGGRRCAAHTRPAFLSTLTALRAAHGPMKQAEAVVAGMAAATEHALTPKGNREMQALLQESQAAGQALVEGVAAGALRMATQAQEMRAEIAAQTAARQAAPAATPVTAADPEAWDYGTPKADVEPHWSIAEGGDRWHAGGCGAFAIAAVERWPHLQIACEMYYDHGKETVAHAWAYDPATSTRFHIYGAESWTPTDRPDYDRDSHRVLLNQTAEDVRRHFRGHNCSEDTVMDAMDVVCEMFDPNFVADDEFDRTHLYF